MEDIMSIKGSKITDVKVTKGLNEKKNLSTVYSLRWMMDVG